MFVRQRRRVQGPDGMKRGGLAHGAWWRGELPGFAPCGLLLLLLVMSSVAAGQTDLARQDFFETKVRPVLAEHCYACHSPQAKKPKGGLLLDTLEGMRKGGDTGPAVVPGKL